MASDPSAAPIPTLKVVVAGDGNVGKTSLIRRYCEGKFGTSRVMTIGVDFQTQRVALPTGEVKLSIWDVAGQDRFQVVRAGFYRGARAVALVYDATVPETFDHLPRWRDEVVQAMPKARFIVVGNKIDLEPTVPASTASEWAASIGAPHVLTSAATGEGVPELFHQLATTAVGSQ